MGSKGIWWSVFVVSYRIYILMVLLKLALLIKAWAFI